ncbi:MAG: AAA family ATPase [Candidatus Dojkabacteria bacterium]|jgi:cytidylate kinase|nr:AAA family ATPase [Candidatus Dojkabacteria bacterium]MDD2270028.1 AAA family ATPase [Candidatus Dojkabacteria bacterium]
MNKQILLVIGGPGKSGSSTIAKRLAEHFNIKRVYAGEIFRDRAKKRGYVNLEEYFKSATEGEINELDREVDRKMREYSQSRNVLIESKIFAALATKEGISCSAKIWLNADLKTRIERALEKEEEHNFLKRFFRSAQIKRDLLSRYEYDRKRYEKLYDIDYNHPEKYNDLVIDSSDQTPEQTFNLIINFLNNAGIK